MSKKMKWVVAETSLESRMDPRLHDSHFSVLITTVNLNGNSFPNNPQGKSRMATRLKNSVGLSSSIPN